LPGPRRPLPGPSPEGLRAGGIGRLIAGPAFLPLAAGLALVGEWTGAPRSLKWIVLCAIGALTFLGLASLVKGCAMLRRGRSSSGR
jgi:hypothetical protein